MSATSISGDTVWWTLPRWKQVWCNLQLKLCDPYLSAWAYINPLTFTFYLYKRLQQGTIAGSLRISDRLSHRWTTGPQPSSLYQCDVPSTSRRAEDNNSAVYAGCSIDMFSVVIHFRSDISSTGNITFTVQFDFVVLYCQFAARCKHGLCRHAVSVCLCLSVTFVHSVKTNKLIFRIFSPSGSHTILVFPYHTSWKYSDGRGRLKFRFWTTIWLCDRYLVYRG